MMNVFFNLERRALARQHQIEILCNEYINAIYFLSNQIRLYAQQSYIKTYYEQYMEEIEVIRTREQIYNELKEMDIYAADLLLIEQSYEISNNMIIYNQAALNQIDQGNFDIARRLVFCKSFDNRVREIIAPVREFQERVNARAASETEKAIKKANIVLFISNVLIIVIPVLLIITYKYLYNKIIGSIHDTASFAGKIANGNLDEVVPLAAEDKSEFGELKRMLNRMLENLRLAKIDPLTKLANRREIMEKIEDETSRYEDSRKAYTLALADIDDFKEVNDTYGHDCGDKALIEFAAILNKHVREKDVVSRWGGEEFLILFPETDVLTAEKICEDIRKALNDYVFKYELEEMSLLATFGVAEYEPQSGVMDVIKKADEALYQGKKSGKNRVLASRASRGRFS